MQKYSIESLLRKVSDIEEVCLELQEELNEFKGSTSEKEKEEVDRLVSYYQSYKTLEIIQVGDFVILKQGLRSSEDLDYGEIAILIEICEEKTDNPFFTQHALLGSLDEEGDFQIFTQELRRLQKWDS